MSSLNIYDPAKFLPHHFEKVPKIVKGFAVWPPPACVKVFGYCDCDKHMERAWFNTHYRMEDRPAIIAEYQAWQAAERVKTMDGKHRDRKIKGFNRMLAVEEAAYRMAGALKMTREERRKWLLDSYEEWEARVDKIAWDEVHEICRGTLFSYQHAMPLDGRNYFEALLVRCPAQGSVSDMTSLCPSRHHSFVPLTHPFFHTMLLSTVDPAELYLYQQFSADLTVIAETDLGLEILRIACFVDRLPGTTPAPRPPSDAFVGEFDIYRGYCGSFRLST
ncbi:hypothetical protein MD484_g8325, partial [Candolleomyces efflorescens]